MMRLNDAILSLLRFLREALSEDGHGSWSRVGSAVVVLGLLYVMVTTRTIPERTEELAWVIAALYGANQLGRFGETLLGGSGERSTRSSPRLTNSENSL